MERPVVLCGLGKVGWKVLEFLRVTGIPVAIIDMNVNPEDPRLAGVTLVRGDCRNLQHLEAVGVATARGVIIATSDDLVNVSTALLVRRLNADGRIVVRMFNQNLIPRFGAAMRNMTALSVSALTAPLLALSALTGDSLGVFKLESGPQQVAEVPIIEGSEFIGRRLTDVAAQYKLLILAHLPTHEQPRILHAVVGDSPLSLGDRFVVCGRPDDLEPLRASGRGDLLSGVLWAGSLRRIARTIKRTLREIDFSVKAGTLSLMLTIVFSTLIFRFAIGTDWADGVYQTVSVVATGSELPGKDNPWWAKLFISGLKIVGALLLSAFTAIFTQYLLRAKLGGAFELRRIPDAGHVVVCGLGNIGFRCVEELIRMGKQVVAIERVNDNPFAATVRRMGVAVVIGDATVPEVLRQARADSARAVIAATSSELANLEVALLVRELNPKQRVVVRLADAEFAEAVREAADIRMALSIPTLAAPAFAAALFGDRVQTLFTIGHRTLAVVEITVQPNDPCLNRVSLVTAMVDYSFLPVGIVGQEPFAQKGIPRNYRLKADDKLTVVIELTDLDRLLRRDPAPTVWSVVLEGFLPVVTETLVPIVCMARGCSTEEALTILKQPGIVVKAGLTRGAAEELQVLFLRERARVKLIQTGEPAAPATGEATA